MLNFLNVRNVTVIEAASLELAPGLNVITGETGAGKSVLVGALKFLTGERFNKASLREGSSKMSVEGIFDVSSVSIPEELAENFDIEDELAVSRESDDTGKNKSFLNGRAAPVSKLKELSEYLIDIHGQHEHQLLFDAERHLAVIDYFVDVGIKNAFAKDFAAFRDKSRELAELKAGASETEKLMEIYNFQLEEINAMNIEPDKDSVIDDTISFMSNIEKIREATAICINLLKDGDINAGSLVARAERSLDPLVSASSELAVAAENLSGASSLINDAVELIQSVFEKQELDPENLNKLIDRKFKLAALMKKYGGDLKSVLEYKEKIEKNLSGFENYESNLAFLEKEAAVLLEKAAKSAHILNEERMKAAFELAEKVENILAELELPQSRFEVRFSPLKEIDAKGGVAAEFFISTNAGFEPGPLSAVASGGEISRVMLALKEVFGEADGVPTMLFDEIDTGISGRAAKSVAVKLKKLAEKKQIIVITHLPVVAARGERHFHITKVEENGVAKTLISELKDADRSVAIATMIAGEATEASIAQAKELLKEADTDK